MTWGQGRALLTHFLLGFPCFAHILNLFNVWAPFRYLQERIIEQLSHDTRPVPGWCRECGGILHKVSCSSQKRSAGVHCCCSLLCSCWLSAHCFLWKVWVASANRTGKRDKVFLHISTSIKIYLINAENLNLGISIVLFATTRVNGLKLFTFPVKSFGRYRKVQLKYCNYFPSRNKQRFLRNVISLELSSLWGVEKQTNKSSSNVASVVLLLRYLVVTGTVRRYRLSRMVFWRSWSTPPLGNLVFRYWRRSLVIEPEMMIMIIRIITK